jgi:hypothetical protein
MCVFVFTTPAYPKEKKKTSPGQMFDDVLKFEDSMLF